jgi:hypothetical protein
MDEDRRSFFQRSSQLAAGALAVGALAASTSEAQAPAQTPSKKLKIMMRSGWGTDDPRAAPSSSPTRSPLPTPDTTCRSSSPEKPPT